MFSACRSVQLTLQPTWRSQTYWSPCTDSTMPPPSSAALPLNVTPSVTPSRPSTSSSSPSGIAPASSSGTKPAAPGTDISSPHELTAFVSWSVPHAARIFLTRLVNLPGDMFRSWRTPRSRTCSSNWMRNSTTCPPRSSTEVSPQGPAPR